MAEQLKFAPTWLFSPHGEMVLCEDQAHYMEVVARGWRDSPAAFGVETHPSHPVQAMPGLTAVLAPPGTEPSKDMLDLLDMVQSGLDSLRAVVEEQGQALLALHEAVHALTDGQNAVTTPAEAHPASPPVVASERPSGRKGH